MSCPSEGKWLEREVKTKTLQHSNTSKRGNNFTNDKRESQGNAIKKKITALDSAIPSSPARGSRRSTTRCVITPSDAGDPRLKISECWGGAFARTKVGDRGTIPLLRRLRGAEAAHPLPLPLGRRNPKVT